MTRACRCLGPIWVVFTTNSGPLRNAGPRPSPDDEFRTYDILGRTVAVPLLAHLSHRAEFVLAAVELAQKIDRVLTHLLAGRLPPFAGTVGQDCAVDPAFSISSDGVINIDLGPDWAAFNETLMDAVTTRAPRGSSESNPSTYWIDRALLAVDSGTREQPFLWGNGTELRLSGDEVVAHSQYEAFEDQGMPLTDFIQLLKAWRAAVLDTRRNRVAGLVAQGARIQQAQGA